MKLKICGLRPGDDLSFTASPAVEYMGVIFVPASRRYVAPADAAAWLRADRPQCGIMGVFVNTPMDDVIAVAEHVGLDGVQLHGREDVAACERLKEAGYTVWKSLTVSPEASPEELLALTEPYAHSTDGLLLDAAPPKGVDTAMTGGHGVRFDWSLMAAFLRAYETSRRMPQLWTAGGFRPDNISAFTEACGTGARPYGIDVSSGVEENGRKSPAKIAQMIQVVNGR